MRNTIPFITTLRDDWNGMALEDPVRVCGVTLKGMLLPLLSYLDHSISDNA